MSMLTPIPHCQHCGVQEVLRRTGLYSRATGEPTETFLCINERCWLGCGNTGGHVWKRPHWWSLYGTCARCGIHEGRGLEP